MVEISDEDLCVLSTYPKNGRYADFLLWHLYVWGTFPSGSPHKRSSEPWKEDEFRKRILGKCPPESEPKNYANWIGRGRRCRPRSDSATAIKRELFGDHEKFRTWADDLDAAWDRSRGNGNNIASIDVKALLEELPPFTPNIKSSVPHPAVYFMGRDTEVEILAKSLLSPEGTGAVLVQGGPGIGKTELTKAVAHHKAVAERYGGRRRFVDLEASPGAEAMKQAIVHAIDGDRQEGWPSALDTLSNQPTLLVLDNLETPWEPTHERTATHAVLAELSEVPGLSILASARGTEIIGGAHWTKGHVLQGLSRDDAANLFVSLAGEWAGSDPHLEKFLNALGGLPLAITLVARRAHNRRSLAPLWERWQEIGTDLAVEPGFSPERSNSLACSIELSLRSERMTDDAMRLLRLLGRSPAGLTDGAIKEQMGDGSFDAIETLIRSGMAIERHDLIMSLPPIQEYLSRNYPISGEGLKRYIAYYVRKFEESLCLETRSAESLNYYFIANSEEFLFFSSDFLEIKKLISLSDIFYSSINLFDRGERVFKKILSVCKKSGDNIGEAECKMVWSGIFFGCGDYERSINCALEASEIYNSLQIPHRRADCILHAGMRSLRYAKALNRGAGGYRQWCDKAIKYHMEAISLFENCNDISGTARSHENLAQVFLFLWELDKAIEEFSRARTLYESIGDVDGAHWCSYSIEEHLKMMEI